MDCDTGPYVSLQDCQEKRGNWWTTERVDVLYLHLKGTQHLKHSRRESGVR
jgi:hypothetical protein